MACRFPLERFRVPQGTYTCPRVCQSPLETPSVCRRVLVVPSRGWMLLRSPLMLWHSSYLCNCNTNTQRPQLVKFPSSKSTSLDTTTDITIVNKRSSDRRQAYRTIHHQQSCGTEEAMRIDSSATDGRTDGRTVD